MHCQKRFYVKQQQQQQQQIDRRWIMQKNENKNEKKNKKENKILL